MKGCVESRGCRLQTRQDTQKWRRMGLGGGASEMTLSRDPGLRILRGIIYGDKLPSGSNYRKQRRDSLINTCESTSQLNG